MGMYVCSSHAKLPLKFDKGIEAIVPCELCGHLFGKWETRACRFVWALPRFGKLSKALARIMRGVA